MLARTQKTNESGIVLVVCLIILLMLSLIGIMSINTSNTDMEIASNEYTVTSAFYAAEAGLEKATSEIRYSYETRGTPPDPLPYGSYQINDYIYQYYTTDLGPARQENLSSGSYKGLYGLVKAFEITSSGTDRDYDAGVTLELGIKDALIPLFQFAVFYEHDLEIAPGPDMMLGGRVHSNADIYLQAGSNLYINSYLTSAGSINHGRKAGSGQSNSYGNVFVLDNNNVYQNMRNSDGTFLDASDDDWVNESLARWGGNVEDANHGITELYLPVVADGPATDLIDRAGDDNADSFEQDAGLRFENGVAWFKQSDGSWVNVTSSLIASGAVSFNTFRDQREGRDVASLDINIALLGSSGYYPRNGIIYSASSNDNGSFPAVRLVNGAQLPGPLTVATVNPLYTVGDYNTVNKQPAAVLADALTILSNNWDDGRSASPLSDRSAARTAVNVSYLTGNTMTAEGHYNGGLENLPRFLENWSNIEFQWRGSAVDLWQSRQANSLWSYGYYYTAPNRNWAFDTDLLDPTKLPPGTPMVNIIVRTSWNQVTSAVSSQGLSN